MESLWEQTSGHTGFGHLEQDAKTDVLIIGGGIAGVLCAYLLHQAGVLYLLLEAETIGGGITKNTTAKITSQHGLIYSRLIQSFGEETARRYAKANQDAVRAYQDLTRPNSTLMPMKRPFRSTGSCAAAWTATLKKRLPMCTL